MSGYKRYTIRVDKNNGKNLKVNKNCSAGPAQAFHLLYRGFSSRRASRPRITHVREKPPSPPPPRHNSHTAGDAQVCQPHFNKQVTSVGLAEFSSSSNSSSYFHIESPSYIVIFLPTFPTVGL